ncbi:hypothetical protein [Streptomyces sp. NBC_01363]|uniref:hypothetical protein n=1 Tax=Streptomyces sp. NBC_01363 TaxID=2903840 RepID=UPI00225651CE|nr:hypothetical protein [Streptomyces sp. NBC_01363]MCX4734625.1 hypothetical protein [Streptomyces sp. NBC_01363]
MPDTHHTQQVLTTARGTAQRLCCGYARFLAVQAPDASTGDHDQNDAAGHR